MTNSRLIAAAIAIVAVASVSNVAAAQGRCIRAYGTPACNTDSIPAVFARTGWRTTSLDHITFRVAEPQKEAAREKKDELDDALSDLNGSTNRLRRKFDATDRWLETKAQVENVLDDARKINQVLTRGKYGSQAERYWSVLRANINDLARCYDLKPLAV